MRFEDLANQIEEMRRFEEQEHDRYRHSAESRRREELREASRRLWPIGLNHQVEFDAESLALYRRRGLSIADATAKTIHLSYVQWKGVGADDGPLTGYSSATLLRAREIALHIEAWVRGEVDDLVPSGLWLPRSAAAPERQGIPYTVDEARLIVADQGHAIDEYHREVIAFLVSEIGRLGGQAGA
jgi:hypothetical protein